MALQIANPVVVNKVERLAQAIGLSKTAAVERAVDQLLVQVLKTPASSRAMAALLAQIDQIPDRVDAFDPLDWNAAGLPK